MFSVLLYFIVRQIWTKFDDTRVPGVGGDGRDYTRYVWGRTDQELAQARFYNDVNLCSEKIHRKNTRFCLNKCEHCSGIQV